MLAQVSRRAGEPSLRIRSSGVFNPAAHFEGAGEGALSEGELAVGEERIAPGLFLALPTQLLQVSANMTNLAAIIFPIVLIYLNRQLPRPARAPWWSYVVLIANVLFFGFFFVNFVAVQLTGQPLVAF